VRSHLFSVAAWILVGGFAAVGLLAGLGRPILLLLLPLALGLAINLLARGAVSGIWSVLVGLGLGLLVTLEPLVLRMSACSEGVECYAQSTSAAAWFGLGLATAGGLLGILATSRRRSVEHESR
jgi:hypothetical protein